MTKVNSTARRKPVKPSKPSKDYPLTAHPNGQWCKKVRKVVHFFGVWADPQAALAKWEFQKDDLQNGRQPRQPGIEASDTDRLHHLLNRFYTSKKAKLDASKLSPHVQGIRRHR